MLSKCSAYIFIFPVEDDFHCLTPVIQMVDVKL